jgi:hypothetical protein
VNLVHRLLKNTVAEQLGSSAYCLYTEPASQRLGFEAVTGLVPHDEDVADFGVVRTYVQDLADAYHSDDEEEITLDPSNVWFSMEADLPMPPAVVSRLVNSLFGWAGPKTLTDPRPTTLCRSLGQIGGPFHDSHKIVVSLPSQRRAEHRSDLPKARCRRPLAEKS